MIITEKNRREICKYLFQEGVYYAKKDFNLAKHPEIDLPNLQVIKLMQGFKSREYETGKARGAGRPFGGPPGGDRPRYYGSIFDCDLDKFNMCICETRFEGERRFGDRDGYRRGSQGPGGDIGDKGGAPADYRPSFGGPGGRPSFGRGSGGYGAATTSNLS